MSFYSTRKFVPVLEMMRNLAQENDIFRLASCAVNFFPNSSCLHPPMPGNLK